MAEENSGQNPSATPPGEDDWQQIRALVDEQKLQSALDLAEQLADRARAAASDGGQDGAAEDWAAADGALAKALLTVTQLRMGLGQFAEAVDQLRSSIWPRSAPQRAAVELFYAGALLQYFEINSWDIRQRERIAGADDLGLEYWTHRQIQAATQSALANVWQQRELWGTDDLGSDTIDIAELFTKNEFPARIRGTARDRLTYLWAGQLADSSQWSAEESNHVFKLDLERLLDPDGLALRSVELSSAQSGDDLEHPLVRMAAVLADLQRWHQRGGRPEAALEAARERFSRLHAVTSDSERSQTLIRQAWDRQLAQADRDLPWWSRAAATAAVMHQANTAAPDNLVTAHRIAQDAVELRPGSVEAMRAAAIADEITAPLVQVEGMATDSAGQRSLQVNHKNVETLHFAAKRLGNATVPDPAQLLGLLNNRNHRELAWNGAPDHRWQIDLPTTTDFKMHQTFVTPPMRQPGLYVLWVSTEPEPGEQDWSVGFTFTVSDLVLLSQTVTTSRVHNDATHYDYVYEYQVVNGSTGHLVAGATVDLFPLVRGGRFESVLRQTTDEHGSVRFDPRDLPSTNTRAFWPVAVFEDQFAVDTRPLSRYNPGTKYDATHHFLYTDRSVYRPQQTLHYKVVVYKGRSDPPQYALAPNTSVEVALVDANGEVVAEHTLDTNEHGSASGEFVLPAGRLLGRWTLRSSVDDATLATSSITVEEYKRPTFEVTIADPPAPLRMNQTAQLEGRGRYLFGLPVSSGAVSWRVTREPVLPPWWEWYRGGFPRRPQQVQTVAQGRGAMAADGTFQIEFLPEAEEKDLDAGITYLYRLSADVTDEGGETRSGTRAFRIGFTAIETSIETALGFVRHELLTSATPNGSEPAEWTLRRTDLDGIARAGTASWRLVRVAQPDRTLLPADQPLPTAAEPDRLQTPGDQLRPRHRPNYNPQQILRSWPDGPTVASGTIEHGDDGEARLDLRLISDDLDTPLAPGVYRWRYATNDGRGQQYTTQAEFIVAKPGDQQLALPGLLLAERSTVAVGQTARFLVHSGLGDQPLELSAAGSLAGADGNQRTRHRYNSDTGTQLVEIPITERLRGGLSAAFTAVRDHQLITQTTLVTVPWDDRKLDFSLASFRDTIRPGDTETWTVTIRHADGEPVDHQAAELLAYMYDRSLDFFAPHRVPGIERLYPTRSALSPTTSSLGALHTRWHQGRLTQPRRWQPFGTDALSLLEAVAGGPGLRNRFARRMMRSRGVADAMLVTSESPMAPSAPRPAPQPTQFDFDQFAADEGEATGAEPAAGTVETEEASGRTTEPQIRTDFSETAFWHPHLLADENGTVKIEFEVPDSVTEWNVWLHALTNDLRGASQRLQAKTVKDLLVRPYLPRFLREGDTAELLTVINNAGDSPLEGELVFDIIDPETEASLLSDFGLDESTARRQFRVQPGEGTNVGFDVDVPSRVGPVAFRVVATAGDNSDGELRPIPVLPARFHLTQSRFTALKGEDQQELHFDDLAQNDDPTRINDQLVVTLDAQLFYSVLNAVPYLVDYPYQCTEQTLNRFLSTGILNTLFEDYPGVATVAQRLSERDSQFEAFDQSDANRTSNSMLFEESPWLNQSRGNRRADLDRDLIKVLDPAVAQAQQQTSFAELRQAQNSDGGFPWFPRGRSSVYITLYLLDGLSRALEFGVALPPEAEQVVRQAWGYLKSHHDRELLEEVRQGECCTELATYLSYVLSNYTTAQARGDMQSDWGSNAFSAAERDALLEHAFTAWRQYSPKLKVLLALSLHRNGRQEDAKTVFDSVMDSAKTDRDLGTYWAPEARSWLWYNDTIEGHALALRAMMELAPDDARRHGLVQWLFLNKKLNHWKSTRATAEVLYALVHYLAAEGQLGIEERASVSLAGTERAFTWAPDEYTGQKTQWVIGPEALDTADEAEQAAHVTISKDTPGLMFASATWHFSTEQLPTQSDEDFFSAERLFYRRVPTGDGFELQPLQPGDRVAIGDEVEVQINLGARQQAEYVHLRDPRAAGFEPINQNSGWRWDLGLGRYEEVRDSGMNFFFSRLPVGEYTLKYRLRATTAGTFRIAPATVQSMYAPEFGAYSTGASLGIDP